MTEDYRAGWRAGRDTAMERLRQLDGEMRSIAPYGHVSTWHACVDAAFNRVSQLQPPEAPVGTPITRAEAIKVAGQIMETAERERREAREAEAPVGETKPTPPEPEGWTREGEAGHRPEATQELHWNARGETSYQSLAAQRHEWRRMDAQKDEEIARLKQELEWSKKRVFAARSLMQSMRDKMDRWTYLHSTEPESTQSRGAVYHAPSPASDRGDQPMPPDSGSISSPPLAPTPTPPPPAPAAGLLRKWIENIEHALQCSGDECGEDDLNWTVRSLEDFTWRAREAYDARGEDDLLLGELLGIEKRP